MFLKLFEPGLIGKVVLKNRMVMTPIAIGGFLDPDGGLSQRAREYYVARAKGGVGLIDTGTLFVTTALETGLFRPAWQAPVLDDRGKLSRLSELADEVHHYGTKLCVQLSPGVGRIAVLDLERKYTK